MSTSSVSEQPLPGRLRYIDAMRGLAVLLMIAVHATDAFLADGYKDGWIWHQVHILYGFVAPAFIFYSGVTFRIALERRSKASRSVHDLLLRGATVIALGYWLQIPSHSLHLSLHSTQLQTAQFLDCNVLQLIGAMMLITLLLYTALKGINWTVNFSLMLCLAIILITPFISTLFVDTDIPSVLSSWILSKGSFPLFPYGAYFLIGMWIVGFLQKCFTHIRGGFWIAGSGIFLLLGSAGLNVLQSTFVPQYQFWHDSPALFLFRLGGILLLTGVVIEGTRKKREGATMLEKFGAASLGIYIIHLMLVYGSPVTMGMQYWFDGVFNHAMTPVETFLSFMLVTIFTSLVVLLWRSYRKHQPQYSQWIIWGWWVGFSALFVLL